MLWQFVAERRLLPIQQIARLLGRLFRGGLSDAKEYLSLNLVVELKEGGQTVPVSLLTVQDQICLQLRELVINVTRVVLG